jgi:hypothetical protein
MDSTTRWTDWVRTTVGIHEDVFSGRVLSDLAENSGNAQASITSPKAGIVFGPWVKTEFYGNAGYGRIATTSAAPPSRSIPTTG